MISFNKISKKKGNKLILDQIHGTFSGSLGIYGENGAGKSTLLNIIALIEQPTNGNIIYKNKRISDKPLRYNHLIGYLPQYFEGFKNHTLKDNLDFLAISKGIKKRRDRKKTILKLMDKLNLTEYQNVKLSNLSGGTVKRAGLCQALINDPEILILDEPTAGVDLHEQMRIRLILSDLKDKGTKIIISSHNFDDLSVLTDNILILKDGILVQSVKTKDVISDNLFVKESLTDQKGLNKLIEENRLISFLRFKDRYKARKITRESVEYLSVFPCSNSEKLQAALLCGEGKPC